MRILIVEDDELLGDGLQAILAQRGFNVDWKKDGLSGNQAIQKETYDLIVLDLNIPGLSGLEILRIARSRGNRTPILVLTARSDIADRVTALDDGADDYLVKPFDVDELCARIRALYRRTRGQTDILLRHRDLMLNPQSRAVALAGAAITISNREFDILQLLLENVGRVLSRRQLEDAVYGWETQVDSNAIEVHIHHLRKKFGAKLIRTVRGVGYMIEKPSRV